MQTTAAVVSYCRPLFEGLVVPATEGDETFEESGIFPGGIYGGRERGKVRKPTPSAHASVFEQSRDGRFFEIFMSLGHIRIRWQEGQVIGFCRDHRDKLRPGGLGTIFELADGLSMAYVRIDQSEKLRLLLLPPTLGHTFEAENKTRFVLLHM